MKTSPTRVCVLVNSAQFGFKNMKTIFVFFTQFLNSNIQIFLLKNVWCSN